MIYIELFFSLKHAIQYLYCMRNIITHHCHIISNSVPRLLLQCAAQLQLEGKDLFPEHTTIHDDQSLYRTHTFLLVDGRHLNTIITLAAYGLCICWTVPQPPTRDKCWTA